MSMINTIQGYTGELSRSDLLNWLNTLTKTPLSKIEQLGAGCTYCELLQIVCPGKMPLAKVHWRAKSEYEFISNFKLLQQCFLKLGISRNIDINKLTKCKYQDNFEFLQWFKRTFDQLALHSKQNIENKKKQIQIHKQSKSVLGNLNNISVIPAPTINLSAMPHEGSKMSKRNNNSSFEEVLGELSVALQSNTGSNKLINMSIREERDFYLSMLDEVQILINGRDKAQTSQELVQVIETLLLTPPSAVKPLEQQSINSPPHAVNYYDRQK